MSETAMNGTMNGTYDEAPAKNMLDRKLGWGRQSSMASAKDGQENGINGDTPIRTVAERQMGWGRQSSTASIRDTLERQASVGSTGSSRRWSPDPSDRGEYSKLQKDMQIMTLKVKALEEKVDKVVKDAGMNLDLGPGCKGAGFTVRLKEATAVRSTDTIIFDDVLTNIGNGYDPETGVFKVPFSGRYMFSLTICAQNQKQVWAEIVADSVVIGQLAAGDQDIDRASASVNVVTYLDKGNEVYVRETKMWTGYFHGDGFTAFTGLLLQ